MANLRAEYAFSERFLQNRWTTALAGVAPLTSQAPEGQPTLLLLDKLAY